MNVVEVNNMSRLIGSETSSGLGADILSGTQVSNANVLLLSG